MRAPRIAVLFGTALLLLVPSLLRADEFTTGLLDRTYIDADGKEAKYALFVPLDYKADKAYPLILFLHGSGETGTDGKMQTYVGLGPVLRMNAKKFPCFVLLPQSQDRSWQADSKDAQRALAVLDAVEKEFKIDEKRVYLTGLSMGGFGTWSLAQKNPERWAAIVPVCGGGDPNQAKVIKDIPCWIFHGDADKSVPVDRSRAMVEALKAAGGQPKYTEYAGVGHNSWEMAYNTPDLYEWLLQQHK
ncbi:MAG TPA: prolyl oligopeptidase family serine peptidase [Gemmataceae bacterium]|nr:prolyl oligopeptidase family serine peptidase [Gemmataceae bacterium]